MCNFCGKGFYSEHYLDKHFDNKHSDKLVKVRTAFYKHLLNAIHYFVLKLKLYFGHSLMTIIQCSSKIIEYLHENLEIDILKDHDKTFDLASFDCLTMGAPLQFVAIYSSKRNKLFNFSSTSNNHV